MNEKQAPPKGLSRGARAYWRQMMDVHTFEAHEIMPFGRALFWWDRSDEFEAAAMKAEGKERAALLKSAMDASTTALRHWRTLKFPNPGGVRRPGRPAGDNWSAKRKAALSA